MDSLGFFSRMWSVGGGGNPPKISGGRGGLMGGGRGGGSYLGIANFCKNTCHRQKVFFKVL